MSLLFGVSIGVLKISPKVFMNPHCTEHPSQNSGTLHSNEHILYRVVICESTLCNIHRSTQDIPQSTYESPTILSTPHSTQAPSTIMNTYYAGWSFMSLLLGISIEVLKISPKVFMNPPPY